MNNNNKQPAFEPPESLSPSSRADIRKQLQEDIAAFLLSGGAIEQIAPNVSAQPPSKPINNYGSRPI